MGLKKVLKKVKKVAKKVAPIAGSAIGYAYGGPAGASIGGSIGGAIKGGAKGALKGGALGGLGGLAYQGMTGGGFPGLPPVTIDESGAYGGNRVRWPWQTPDFNPNAQSVGDARPFWNGSTNVTPDVNIGYDDAWPMPDSGGGGTYGGFPMPSPDINVPNQGQYPPMPTGGSTGTGVAGAAGASAAAQWAAKQYKKLTGQDIDPATIDMLGKGVGIAGGVYSANKQADQTQQLNDQMISMANQDRTDRLPYLNQSTNWLTNPADFWSGSAGQELARQTGRVIGGARGENLFDSQTGQSLVMQSLAPMWLNAVTQTANLGLKNTSPLSELSNIGMANVKAQGAPGAVLGAGVQDIFNPAGSLALGNNNDLLRRLLMGKSGGSTSALS